jgi:hypothetical protein
MFNAIAADIPGKSRLFPDSGAGNSVITLYTALSPQSTTITG